MLRALFVSDIHITSPMDRRGELFLGFLKSIKTDTDASHLFLLGDIFDMWIAAHPYFIDRYELIIQEIVRIRDLGVEVHFFEGNHDLYLDHYWGKDLGLTIQKGPTLQKLGRWSVRLEHGDQMDPSDRGYQFLRWFLRTGIMKTLAPSLPSSLVVKIGETASEKSRTYTSEVKTISNEATTKVIRDHAQKVAEKQDFDLIITGHVHQRDDWTFTNMDGRDVRSVNLGTWLEQPCYASLTDDGLTLHDLHTH